MESLGFVLDDIRKEISGMDFPIYKLLRNNNFARKMNRNVT